MYKFYLTALLFIGLTACTTNRHLREAKRILRTTPVVDTHIDFPWHLVERNKWYKPGYEAWVLDNPEGDFDYKRAKKGSVYGPFMSIYIPSKFQAEAGRSKKVADSLINTVEAIAKAYPDKFALAKRASDIEENYKKGIISLPMGMENGSPIEQLEDVTYFHQRGIRYVTLTHALDNKICDSSYDTTRTNGGLSPFGEKVVHEMNRVGIMVDISHLSDESVEEVLKVAQKPLLASHSACRHYSPDFKRNMPDHLIKAVAQTKGVIQVPFSMFFLSTKHRKAFQKAEDAMGKQKVPQFGPTAKRFLVEYAQKTGEPVYGDVRDVANHIDYIKNLVGVDYVGLGSDFDGVGLSLPRDLADVSMIPNLVAELLRRGYTESDIRKVCYQNVLRVWRANE
jgi:membrane dipeptidase